MYSLMKILLALVLALTILMHWKNRNCGCRFRWWQ